MNTGAPCPSLIEANARVLEIQTKLHRWASENENRRFGDLFNLVCDPAFLRVACERVRSNKGTELGRHEDTLTGTPQGGILSPVLANIALSVPDLAGWLIPGRWRLT